MVRAVHRHRTGVGSIPAGGPYSWWIFLNCSRLEFRHVYNFHSILRHINPLPIVNSLLHNFWQLGTSNVKQLVDGLLAGLLHAVRFFACLVSTFMISLYGTCLCLKFDWIQVSLISREFHNESYLPGGHLIRDLVSKTRGCMCLVVSQKALNLPVWSFTLLILVSRYGNTSIRQRKIIYKVVKGKGRPAENRNKWIIIEAQKEEVVTCMHYEEVGHYLWRGGGGGEDRNEMFSWLNIVYGFNHYREGGAGWLAGQYSLNNNISVLLFLCDWNINRSKLAQTTVYMEEDFKYFYSVQSICLRWNWEKLYSYYFTIIIKRWKHFQPFQRL